MNNKQLTFLVLNGLLNGINLRQIGAETNVSEEELCSIVGTTSYKEFDELFESAKEHYELKDEEKVILNFLSMPEYVFALLDTGNADRFYGYETLTSIASAKVLNLDVIPDILLEFLPTIKSGKTAKAVDGVLYLPAKYVDSKIALDNLLIDCFNYYFYGKPLLTKKQASQIFDNLQLDQAPTMTPKELQAILLAVAKKGYKLSAVTDLFRKPIHNYVDSYSITGAVMEFRAEDDIRLLSYGKNGEVNTGSVLLIPAQIMTKLSNSPRLFEDSYLDNGCLYIKTNVGYKQLIVQEDVSV